MRQRYVIEITIDGTMKADTMDSIRAGLELAGCRDINVLSGSNIIHWVNGLRTLEGAQ